MNQNPNDNKNNQEERQEWTHSSRKPPRGPHDPRLQNTGAREVSQKGQSAQVGQAAQGNQEGRISQGGQSGQASQTNQSAQPGQGMQPNQGNQGNQGNQSNQPNQANHSTQGIGHPYHNMGQQFGWGAYPPGQRMPGANASNNRRKSALFPVLLSIFLTFAITASMVWALAVQGILPGTQNVVNEMNLPEGYKVGDFGLSIHTDDPDAEKAADKLAEIIAALQDNYYKVLSPEEILNAMSVGLADHMDSKYTYYMPQEEVAAFLESMSGNYSGIGATVSMDEASGAFQIVSVIENGPAWEAGLQAQDIVTKVDGQDASQFENPTDLANTVKGEAGTTVVLTVIREGEEKEISIVRGQVQVELVHTRMLNEKLGYMSISEFSTNLPEQFEEGIVKLMADGAENIVFDMRGNPGGSADAVIKVLDSLLGEKLIATVRGREEGEQHEEVWTSDAEKIVPDEMRYAILVNGGSASAAELFSGVLQDHGKAVLIGETTYGKGSGTIMYRLGDGSAVNITIFNYFLPSGRLIEETGLEPDIPAENIEAEYRSIPMYRLEPEQDDALQKAIDHLSTQSSSGGASASRGTKGE